MHLARNVANGQLAAVKRRLTDNWIHYQEVHALRILEGVPGVVRLIDEGRAIPGRGDTSWANRELVLILEYIEGAPAHLEDMPTLASIRLFFLQFTRVRTCLPACPMFTTWLTHILALARLFWSVISEASCTTTSSPTTFSSRMTWFVFLALKFERQRD